MQFVATPRERPPPPKNRAGILAVFLIASAVLAGLAAIPAPARAFTARPPIAINGDAAFTAANGVTGGSGVAGDPFVIQGWEINASTADGIAISNTRAAFLMRDVYIHSYTLGTYSGILLTNVSNGVIENSTVTENWGGVTAFASSNLTVVGNLVAGNPGGGVSLSGSGSSLFGNNVSDNGWFGGEGVSVAGPFHVIAGNRIALNPSRGLRVTGDNVTIASNTISRNGRGLELGGRNATIQGNVFESDGVIIGGYDLPFWNTHTITPDNLVNGKPMRFHRDCDGLEVDGVPVGQLIVANCRNVRAANLVIDDAAVGIQMAFVDRVLLARNTIANHSVFMPSPSSSGGVLLIGGTNVMIANNTLVGNDNGVSVGSSSHIILADNRISEGHAYGSAIRAGYVANLTIEGNDISRNNGETAGVIHLHSGDLLNPLRDVRIARNAITENEGVGLLISGYATNVTVSDNAVRDNWWGIRLEALTTQISVFHNAIENNTLFAQAEDDAGPQNAWDDGYPSGGNYWSDYTGVDDCSGPLQNVCPDPDGIGDTPYVIDADSEDRYPLMAPPAPADSPPIAFALANASSAYLNVPVRFDATGSTDDVGIVAYEWDFGDGNASTAATPTHAYATRGMFPVTLTVRDGANQTDADLIWMEVPNRGPNADAGLDQAVLRNAPVTLQGSGSDPDGDALTYAWTQAAGPPVTLTGADTPNPAFTPALEGAYAFRLTVDDGFGGNGTDDVVVLVANQGPFALAGPDRTVAKKTTVALDGTGSWDPEGDALTYAWTQAAGPPVTLTGADSATPSFVPPTSGLYEFELLVDDGHGGNASDAVSVTATNAPPVADAGADRTAAKYGPVSLDASASPDPDGDPLIFTWTQIGGPPVTLTGADTATPSFTPVRAGTYVFQVAVDDGDGGVATDEVSVTVDNTPPVADAGPDPVVQKGSAVTLDARASSDPDGDPLSYAWSQVEGPPASLSGADTATPSFTPVRAGTYVFQVAVDDGDGGTATATATVTVWGLSPSADLQVPSTVRVGEPVAADAAASGDPDGAIVDYRFDFGDGTVANGSASVRSHAYDAPGTFVLRLVVTDDDGNTSAVERIIQVTLPESEASVLPWVALLAVLVSIPLILLWARRRRRGGKPPGREGGQTASGPEGTHEDGTPRP